MDKGSAALTGAGTGAAVGTAIMPGIGTAVGAGLGAVGGWFLGKDSDASQNNYSPDQSNFQYGLGQYVDAQGVVHPTPEERAAYAAQQQAQLGDIDKKLQDLAVMMQTAVANGARTGDNSKAIEIARAIERVKADRARVAAPGAEGQDNFAAQRTRETIGRQNQADQLATDAYNRGTPGRADFAASRGQGYLDGADTTGRGQQMQALNGLNNQVSALNNFAGQAEGPSAAQAQLRLGTDTAARQQYSAARTQPGGGGAAMRNAAFNVAGLQGQSANQSAMLRSQETNDYHNRQLAALNAAMGGAGQSAGYAGQVRAGDQAFAQTQASQANYDANAQNQYGLEEQNAQLQARQQNDAMTLGAIGSSQQYDQFRNQYAAGQSGAGQSFEGAKAAAAGSASGNYMGQQQFDNQNFAAGLGAVGAGLAAYTATQNATDGPNAGAQAAGAGHRVSDERQKKLKRQESSLAAALGTLGNAPGYSYKYKDTSIPGTAPGTQVSSMAQDLERGPLGDRIVTETSNGKMVNYDEVAKMTPGAITELNRKVSALERALGKAA